MTDQKILNATIEVLRNNKAQDLGFSEVNRCFKNYTSDVTSEAHAIALINSNKLIFNMILKRGDVVLFSSYPNEYFVINRTKTIDCYGHPSNDLEIYNIGDALRVEQISNFLYEPIEGLYENSLRAHSNISFDPERRAVCNVVTYVNDLMNKLNIVKDNNADVERFKTKYISLLNDWLSAKSRTFSTMITGGSGVNIRKHQKANDSEHNKYAVFTEWNNKVLKKIQQKESTDIVKGTKNALSQMVEKLGKLESQHKTSLAINKILRSKKLTAIEKEKEILLLSPDMDVKLITEMIEYNYLISLKSKQIKDLKSDIIAEKARAEKYADGNKEYEINGYNVIENVEANRIQILFDDKPEPEVISQLKKKGFRWSGKFSAWQRQLTLNGINATKFLLENL